MTRIGLAPTGAPVTTPPATVSATGSRWARVIGQLQFLVALEYLIGTGVHAGIVAVDAESYRGFGAHAAPGIRDAWLTVFMAEPAFWGMAVAAGELTIGLLLLSSGLRARLGIVLAIGFHLALLLFGWWAWFYAVPALIVLALIARSLFAATPPTARMQEENRHGRRPIDE